MNSVSLTINGKQTQANAGTSIMVAANNAGIYIPGLCYHPELRSTGDCGLCLVSIEGKTEYLKACVTEVTNNMVVQTNSEELRGKRREVIKGILKEHPPLKVKV